MEIRKNQIYTVKITDMGAGGEGIGHLEELSDARQADGFSGRSGSRRGGVPCCGDSQPGGFSGRGDSRRGGVSCCGDSQPGGFSGRSGSQRGGFPCRRDSQPGDGGPQSGYTLFVKDAVIGDIVEARIVKPQKGYAFARLEKLVEPSPDRVEAVCPYARQCGGCQIQTLSYEKQLEFKDRKVKNNLIRIGGFDADFIEQRMEEPVGMEDPFHYRNKAQFPVGTDKEGHLTAGFYAGRTHTIIENRDCALGAPENKLILDLVLGFCEEKKISAYDETTGKGLLRHVLIRKGFSTGQVMVCLILNGTALPQEERLADILFAQVPGMTSFSVNTNTEATNVILGKKTRLIRGKERIEDTIGGLTFSISPLSFYQVNPVQTEKIYSQALSYAQLSGKETVWDLYCGIGTISLFLAQKAREVYGVEIVPQAIEDAGKNALRNGISNAHFYVGKAEEVLPEKYEKEGISADVIVVDPPRKGCDSACLATMVRMRPERIVYVSCDSATLARDLKYLCANGYEFVKGRAIDNFPQSVHVEGVVLLCRT